MRKTTGIDFNSASCQVPHEEIDKAIVAIIEAANELDFVDSFTIKIVGKFYLVTGQVGNSLKTGWKLFFIDTADEDNVKNNTGFRLGSTLDEMLDKKRDEHLSQKREAIRNNLLDFFLENLLQRGTKVKEDKEDSTRCW